jgi:hypothetical protein
MDEQREVDLMDYLYFTSTLPYPHPPYLYLTSGLPLPHLNFTSTLPLDGLNPCFDRNH